MLLATKCYIVKDDNKNVKTLPNWSLWLLNNIQETKQNKTKHNGSSQMQPATYILSLILKHLSKLVCKIDLCDCFMITEWYFHTSFAEMGKEIDFYDFWKCHHSLVNVIQYEATVNSFWFLLPFTILKLLS